MVGTAGLLLLGAMLAPKVVEVSAGFLAIWIVDSMSSSNPELPCLLILSRAEAEDNGGEPGGTCVCWIAVSLAKVTAVLAYGRVWRGLIGITLVRHGSWSTHLLSIELFKNAGAANLRNQANHRLELTSCLFVELPL